MSALRPAFFILYLEFFISRLNEILRHDLTLSVGEPDNAAAKQGQELRSEQTVTHPSIVSSGNARPQSTMNISFPHS